MTEEKREESPTATPAEQPTEPKVPEAPQLEPKPEPAPPTEVKVAEKQPPKNGGSNVLLGSIVILLILSVGFSGYIYRRQQPPNR